MLSCLNWVSSELRNVFMGSTFSELFYFYFQRAKKRERKQGGIVVIELFYFFNVNGFLCTVFYHHHYSMQGFVFIIISSFWGGFIVNINKLYDFEMRALFSFPISEWILMRVHAEVDCFWLILPPFPGWLQKISVKQIFFQGKRN